MAGKEFVILYTHQKTKKRKTWQDGVLKISVHGNRAELYDDNNTRLDALYVKPEQSLLGEQLESDKYLITIEEQKSAAPCNNDSENTNPTAKAQQQLPTQCAKPMHGLPLRQPLKRRRTGFTVPRQVISKPNPESSNVSVTSSNNASADNTSSTRQQTNKPSLFNTQFSNKSSSSSQQSFFNMYGKSGNNPQNATDAHAQMTSFGTANNVSTNTTMDERGDYITKQACAQTPVHPCDAERLESLEPVCFEAATPTSIDDSSGASPHITCNIASKTTFSPVLSSQGRKKETTLESHNQGNLQTMQQVVESTNQSNKTVAGKRSASQILALLGRSRGQFKPPLKKPVNSTVNLKAGLENQSGHCDRGMSDPTHSKLGAFQADGNTVQTTKDHLYNHAVDVNDLPSHQRSSVIAEQDSSQLGGVGNFTDPVTSTSHAGLEETADSASSCDHGDITLYSSQDIEETQPKTSNQQIDDTLYSSQDIEGTQPKTSNQQIDNTLYSSQDIEETQFKTSNHQVDKSVTALTDARQVSANIQNNIQIKGSNAAQCPSIEIVSVQSRQSSQSREHREFDIPISQDLSLQYAQTQQTSPSRCDDDGNNGNSFNLSQNLNTCSCHDTTTGCDDVKDGSITGCGEDEDRSTTGCEDFKDKSTTGCEDVKDKSTAGCEDVKDRTTTCCEDNEDRFTTGCEDDKDRSTTGCEDDKDRSTTGCEDDKDRSTTGCEDDEDRSTTGCEVDEDRSTTGCEVDKDRSTTGCEDDKDRSTTGCEDDKDRSTTGCEDDKDRSTTGCEDDKDKYTIDSEDVKDRSTTGCEDFKEKSTTSCDYVLDKSTTGCDYVKDKTTTCCKGVEDRSTTGCEDVTDKSTTDFEDVKERSTTGCDYVKDRTTTGCEDVKDRTTTGCENVKDKSTTGCEDVKEKSTTGWEDIKDWPITYFTDIEFSSAVLREVHDGHPFITQEANEVTRSLQTCISPCTLNSQTDRAEQLPESHIDVNLKHRQEVLENLLNSVESQESATSVDTLDIPLSSDQSFALAAKLDSKLSEILSQDNYEDWTFSDEEMLISAGNKDGIVPDSPVITGDDDDAVQDDDLTVPQVTMADVHQSVNTTDETDNSIHHIGLLSDVAWSKEMFQDLSLRQDNGIKRRFESLDDEPQCVPEFNDGTMNSLLCGTHSQDEACTGFQHNHQSHMVPPLPTNQVPRNQRIEFEFDDQQLTNCTRSAVDINCLSSEEFPWITRNSGIHSNIQARSCNPSDDVRDIENSTLQQNPEIIPTSLPIIEGYATTQSDLLNRDFPGPEIPVDVMQTSDWMHHAEDTMEDPAPLMNTRLSHTGDLKKDKKSLKKSMKTERTSTDVKINKGDMKRLHYWRKPVSSATIKRGPPKATHGRAIARRQDLQDKSTPVFISQIPDLSQWNHNETPSPLKNVLPPPDVSSFERHQDGIQEARQRPGLNFDDGQFIERQTPRQRYETTSPLNNLLPPDVSSYERNQDVVQEARPSPCLNFDDGQFIERQRQILPMCDPVNDDNRRDACITPVSSSWNYRIPTGLNMEDTSRFTPHTPYESSQRAALSTPPFQGFSPDQFYTINVTPEMHTLLSPVIGMENSPTAKSCLGFQTNEPECSPEIATSSALQLFDSPKMESYKPSRNRFVVVDQEDPRDDTALDTFSKLATDLPESQEDMFIPITHHTQEMFSPRHTPSQEDTFIPITHHTQEMLSPRCTPSQEHMFVPITHHTQEMVSPRHTPSQEDTFFPNTHHTQDLPRENPAPSCSEARARFDGEIDSVQPSESCQMSADNSHQQVSRQIRERKPLVSQAPQDTHITPFSFSQSNRLQESHGSKSDKYNTGKMHQEQSPQSDVNNSSHLTRADYGIYCTFDNKNSIQGNRSCVGLEQPSRFKAITQCSRQYEDSDRFSTTLDSSSFEKELYSRDTGDRQSSSVPEDSVALSTELDSNSILADRSVISTGQHSIGFSRAHDSTVVDSVTSSLDRIPVVCNVQSPYQQRSHRTADLSPGMTAPRFLTYQKQPALGNNGSICTSKNSVVPGPNRIPQPSRPAASFNKRKGFQNPALSVQGFSQRNVCGEFFFPSSQEVQDVAVPQRQVRIPVFFSNLAMYKQVMIGALKEHLNIILFKLAQQYHSALSKVDLSGYAPASGHTRGDQSQTSSTGNSPVCEHGTPSKMVCVKKDGPNKGRFFYVCSSPRGNQCKFFMWADQYKGQMSSNNKTDSTQQQTSHKGLALSDPGSISTYFKSHHIPLYCQCELLKKTMNSYNTLPNVPAWVKKYKHQDGGKKKMYLKLSHKATSSSYAKDDMWVISQEMNFDPSSTFLAKSIYHGPSSSNEIEIEPVSGYSPSNWPSGCMVHAIHAGNASSELTCISNIQEHINARTLPILPHILNGNNPEDQGTVSSSQTGGFRPPSLTQNTDRMLHCTDQQVIELAEQMIRKYGLNPDQAEAVQRVAVMFIDGRNNRTDTQSITLIHGVFGAGKSFLLAVTVLFLVQLFELSDMNNPEFGSNQTGSTEWKLLIASTTNVAVDRILLGLLELGFEDFIRVGSVRKIAKPVLPYSVHAADKEKQELKELQEMLKTDLTPSEKLLVRKSIERQRLGQNKELLSRVRVVGVTCAACTFASLSCLKFPVVLLDECSQMTEPASLLPIARFECEKLVLVGDPKQLNPTIQGSEPAHNASLEQTLLDRLLIMGYEPILLRTQYRCHPRISAIASSLFYDNQLIDGVTEEDRPKLVDGFPTLCIYNISNGQEVCASDGSFYNDQEATFVVFLIEALLVSGLAPSSIGVITLYKAQMRKVHQMLLSSSVHKANEMKCIQISTVDAFQGGEKDIIILSSVRTDYMGFADSDKRTNVALTRSKHHLLIVGNLRILTENALWGQVVHKCQEHPDGIQSSQAFTRRWKDKITEAQKGVQETGESKTKRRSNLKTTNVKESTEVGTKRKKISPLTQPKSANSESQVASQCFGTQEPMTPDYGNSKDQAATPQNASFHSNSSPSYSPLEHVVNSDSESDEELPSFDMGEL